ncbi:hypothetical protein GTY65_19850 [Streptomyces sp. SID8379]|uniref:hypothetical protein n=1 Tax=unclassified Streptomyces TaxID=2593676 RepID=UPI0003697AFD|nr:MULTISPECIES: hypothetical protein [unclassified Streptomyces]MYW66289.1 hypothetical protein [Streptomyces sp. SID8379]
MTATVARMPADASDDLLRKLHVEHVTQVPAERRSTCATHLQWRDLCAQMHERGAA